MWPVILTDCSTACTYSNDSRQAIPEEIYERREGGIKEKEKKKHVNEEIPFMLISRLAHNVAAAHMAFMW